jgi:hypothetical protein
MNLDPRNPTPTPRCDIAAPYRGMRALRIDSDVAKESRQ